MDKKISELVERELRYWELDKQALVNAVMQRDEQIERLEDRVDQLRQKIFFERAKIASIFARFDDLKEANRRGFVYPLELEERLGEIKEEISVTVSEWKAK
jgi:tetrahydromethanopterin S-methyltransferase subunit G